MLLASLLLPLAFAPPDGLEAVQAIFDESCTACHDGGGETPPNLEDVSALIGRPSSTGKPLIDPGNPNGSYLYLKMVGAEGIEGEPMPQGGDQLPAEQLEVISKWIASLPASGGEPPPDGGGEVVPPEGGGEVVLPEGGGESPEVGGGEPTGDVPKKKQKKKPKYPPFFGTQNINLQTTTTLGKRTIAYRIHHRLGIVGGPGDRTYIGLAGGAIMSMGVEYGIVDGLDVLARWTNSRLDWELGLKYVPVRQGNKGMPVSFGMYASFEALTDFPTSSVNRLTGNFQALLSRLWFDRWATQLVVNYSLLTNHAPTVLHDFGDGNGPEPVTDNRGTLNVGIASTVWVGNTKRSMHGIDLEYQLPIPVDAFYYHGGNVDPNGSKVGSWGLGWSARTSGHVFQVIVTNTRNIHTNLAAPGGDTANPFKPFGDFFFGFNITRKWTIPSK